LPVAHSEQTQWRGAHQKPYCAYSETNASHVKSSGQQIQRVHYSRAEVCFSPQIITQLTELFYCLFFADQVLAL